MMMMKNGSNNLRPLIRVHTRHPLAFQIIQGALTACGLWQDGEISFASEGDAPQYAGQLLILDSCSGDEWLEMAVSWHQSGGKVILLLSPLANQEREQLRLLYLGISGLVLISPNLNQELPRAVSTVLAGELWVRRDTLMEYVRRNKPAAEGSAGGGRLTPREEQIISFLLRDYSNKRIAYALGISERTVKYHVSNIFQKAQVGTRKELRAVTRRNPRRQLSEMIGAMPSAVGDTSRAV